ncbi:hypothetical protein Pyn_10454 [Prunus yedoensis var. nudiflora]|uniref:Uncharacterized protein n=1 Tax=Prunus yedoensis var. nudiflora TaxID=2094558 RepID=A0A314ZQZ8_PRUYE|nr:hypothetical protein Pyn_10454 [Prunus yedoensis var. nudiflora]
MPRQAKGAMVMHDGSKKRSEECYFGLRVDSQNISMAWATKAQHPQQDMARGQQLASARRNTAQADMQRIQERSTIVPSSSRRTAHIGSQHSSTA